MKSLSFHCPHCGQHIEAEQTWAGRDLDCPTCRKAFVVPSRSRNITSIIVQITQICILLFFLALTGLVIYFKQIQPRAEEAAEQAKFQAHLREINPEKFEDAWQTKERLREEAERVQLKACSNYLGFTRIIDHYVNATPDEVSNWTGNATVDFVNRQGGAERTNLLFIFWKFEHHVIGDINESAKPADRRVRERLRL
jgi:hypothetical protein